MKFVGCMGGGCGCLGMTLEKPHRDITKMVCGPSFDAKHGREVGSNMENVMELEA